MPSRRKKKVLCLDGQSLRVDRLERSPSSRKITFLNISYLSCYVLFTNYFFFIYTLYKTFISY